MCVFDIFGAASSQGGDIEHPMGEYAAVWSMPMFLKVWPYVTEGSWTGRAVLQGKVWTSNLTNFHLWCVSSTEFDGMSGIHGRRTVSPCMANRKCLPQSHCCVGRLQHTVPQVVMGWSRDRSNKIGAPTLSYSTCGGISVSSHVSIDLQAWVWPGNSYMSQLFRKLTFSFSDEIMLSLPTSQELFPLEPGLGILWFELHETGCKLVLCSRNGDGVRMILQWVSAAPHIIEKLAEVGCYLAVWQEGSHVGTEVLYLHMVL